MLKRVEELRVKRGGLRASLLYSLAGQGFYLTTQLGVLSALAHFRGPIAVGEFGLALAVTTPLFLLSNLGFRTAQASDVEEEFSFAQYGGVRLLLTALAVLISIVLGWSLSDNISTLVIVAIVSLTKAFESVSNLAYGAFQQGGRMDLVARSLAVRGALTLPFFAVLLWLGADTATAFLAQLGVWAAAGMLLDYPSASRIASGRLVWPSWAKGRSSRLIWRVAPLGGGQFINSVQMSVPRILVERYLGLDALGLFTAVGYFQQAGVSAANSVSHAIVNRIAKLRRTGQRRRIYAIVIKLAALFVFCGALWSLLCFYFGVEMLVFLFGHSYIAAAPLLFIISLAMNVRMLATLPQTVLYAEQRYSTYMTFQVVSFALTVALCFTFIERFGLVGAGYVLLTVAILRLLVMEALALFLGKRPPPASGTSGGHQPWAS
jgi:O-antigen/teichoic acid export membrane protein